MSDRTEFGRLLATHFSVTGKVSEPQVDLLWQHYELLVRWNRVVNLTGISRLEEALMRHYCESLFVALHLPAEPVSVLDVGSGAGFPGVPMAIYRPDCLVTLTESHQRKAAFLREATRSLPNVRVVAKRAESITETFDWVVSRAVPWEQLRRRAAWLGRTVGLLLSLSDAQRVRVSEEWRWQAPVPVPWSRTGVLLLGSLRFT